MEKYFLVINQNYPMLNPYDFGYVDCEKNYFFGPFIREHWVLHYVVSGKGIFKINGKTYNVSSGEIFVIPPYVETFYQADEVNPWSYIWIGFTNNGKLPVELPDIIKCNEAKDIFNSMKKSENLENGRSAFLASKLWELFAYISEEKEQSFDLCEKTRNIIEADYMKDISVEMIADTLGVNRSYLSVIFKEKYGISPKKYLLNHRMNVAKNLLNKDISVSTTANSVGYTDMFVFSKMFKKFYGISPSKYKASIK